MIEESARGRLVAAWAKKAAERDAEVRGAQLFAALIFFLIGAFAVTVGAHDAFSSIEIASRFGGLLLLFAALALIVVALGLTAALSWSTTAGVAISFLGAIIGLSFISAQLLSVDGDWWPLRVAIGIAVVVLAVGIFRHWGPLKLFLLSAGGLAAAYLYFLGGDHDERLIFWAAIVFASALAGFALVKVRPPKVPTSAAKVLGGMAGFFTLSALIGGAQLWYTSQYLPASLGASLSVESHLTRLPARGEAEVARLTLSIQNTGQTQATILGSLYRITAAPLHAVELRDWQMREALEEPQVYGRTASRFRRSFDWDVVQAGRIFDEGSWLDPEEQFSTDLLIYLPRGRYDILRSKAAVMIAKGKALTLAPGGEEFRLTEPVRRVRQIASVWPIEETSWFRQLTRSDRELEIDWVASRIDSFQAARFPHLRIAVRRVDTDDDIDELNKYNERLFATYGLGEALSSTEIALGRPVAGR
jgi:hypothetical protein